MVSTRSFVILTGILGVLTDCNALVPSLGTEVVIAKHKEGAEKLIDYAPLSGRGLAPFISNFLQKGTNLFFKPQFMLSSAHIPSPIQTMIVENDEDCIKTPIASVPLIPPAVVMDEPLVPVPIIIEKPPAPVMIPEAPVLPPLALPVPPVPVVIDCEEEKVVKPRPLPIIPMPIPPVPVIIEEPPAPILIPEAPVLPPLALPVPPPVPVVIDCEEEKVVEPHPLPVKPIPPAPVLPPLSLPAFPVPVVNDCEENVIISNPPELPVVPMVPPTVIVPEPPVPVLIPEAPQLPPLSLPNLPVAVVKEQVECDDVVVKEIEKPLVIPTATVVEMPLQPAFIPALPQFHHAFTPQVTVVREKIEMVDKIVMPSFPLLNPIISFPAECVQNIITERVLPNILTQQISKVVPSLPSYPVPSPYFPTLIKMF